MGVFRLVEKVAKAPDPRPNAVEADVEGEGREVTRGLTLLKGLKCRPCELESPPRDLLEADGGPKTFCDVGPSLDIDNESLLVVLQTSLALRFEQLSMGLSKASRMERFPMMQGREREGDTLSV